MTNKTMTISTTSATAMEHEMHDLGGKEDLSLPVSSTDDGTSTASGRLEIKDKTTTLEAFWIISIITGVTFISVSGTGILTTALPRIATDIHLDNDLIFWPASVYSLSAGCTLLAFGSAADVIGSKRMWLIGSGVSCPLILACGLAQTGVQFILFRAMLGLFVAMCLPTSMSLVTASFEPGPKRNIAFAATGVGQPLGYALGLILGGVLTDTIGWRWGFYITAIADGILFVASIFILPTDRNSKKLSKDSWHRLAHDIDWVGVVLLAVSLGLLSYVLAMITLSYRNIGQAQNIILLVISLLLLPAFSHWEDRQVKRQKVALIPNSLWRNLSFTFICTSMFLTWAGFNAFQYMCTLFFQEVQHISALQTSIRFLPMAVTGVLTNVVAGLLVAKVDVNILVGVSAVITTIAPILMAIASPQWTFWAAAFVAITLSPITSDVLWTVSSLVICRAFPPESQALAGGVFSTISQLGNTVGLTITAAIAASVTTHHKSDTDTSSQTTDQLLQGYRAGYWTIFAAMIIVWPASFFGLRKVGKVGLKQD